MSAYNQRLPSRPRVDRPCLHSPANDLDPADLSIRKTSISYGYCGQRTKYFREILACPRSVYDAEMRGFYGAVKRVSIEKQEKQDVFGVARQRALYERVYIIIYTLKHLVDDTATS